MSIVKYDTIYKRTSAGKIQMWFMEREGNKYRSTSGQTDGKTVTTEWTVATGKNVGRANETSPEEQAILEIEAEYDKKLARDYHRDINTVDVAMRFKPILASKWKDRKDKVEAQYSEVFVDPKLDGCVSGAGTVITENGVRTVEEVFNGKDEMILSFNTETLKSEFNRILGRFKNAKNTQAPKKWLKITTETGRIIEVTDNHRVFMPELNTWREAGELDIGDSVLTTEN